MRIIAAIDAEAGRASVAVPESGLSSTLTSMPETPANAPDPRRVGLQFSRRNWLIVAAAFGIGLLLFLLLWLDHRNHDDFYRADAPVSGPSGQVFEPLPVPMPADADSGASTPGQGESAPGMVGIDETRPATPPAPPTAPDASMPVAASPAAPRQSLSQPRLLGKPSAPYPPQAYRDGESGTVMLRVTIGPDGVPGGIALAHSSGSRALDRAAMGAVRSWRFTPAMRDGQPVAATVQIPVAYNLDER